MVCARIYYIYCVTDNLFEIGVYTYVMEHERENFYRIITLILKLGTKCLKELLNHFLQTENLTLQQLLSQYQHELYHLYYNSVKCCRCTNNKHLSRKRILNLCQFDILYGVNPTKPQGGQSSCNYSGFCCCQITTKASLTTTSLDFTLTKCLLINTCEKVFVNDLLQSQSFESFLNNNRHDVYHAWKPQEKCCQCLSGGPTSCHMKQMITDKQWATLYGVTQLSNTCPICGCVGNVCSLKAVQGIIWDHLDRQTAITVLKIFSPLRRTLDELAEYRNVTYGHALDVKIENNLFNENWSKIKSCIMALSAPCRGDVKQIIAEEIDFIKSGPLEESTHKQYHTFMLKEIRDNSEMKEEILGHLKATTENIKDNQIGVESTLETLNEKLDLLLNLRTKESVEITSIAIQTDHGNDKMHRDLIDDFEVKLLDKENEVQSLGDRIDEIQQYKTNYQRKAFDVKQAIQHRSRSLQVAIMEREREFIEELEVKERDAIETLETQKGAIEKLKITSGKKLSNYRKMIDTIGDDREMADQFIQDSMPALISISTDITLNFPTSLIFNCGKANNFEFGDLKEDTRLCSVEKEKAFYLDKLKIRRKFKVECTTDRVPSIYTVSIRPDGKIWLTTMTYKLIVANRQGRVLASEKLKFTIFHTQCDKNGDLYCCAGTDSKILTAYYDDVNKSSGSITLCEFENMAPLIARSLHINPLNQLLVLLGHGEKIKAKVTIFSPERMVLKEINIDYNQLLMKEDLLYITQNSEGKIYLSGPQTLVHVDVESDTCKYYNPGDGAWEGKRIIIDQQDNIISSESRNDGDVKIHVTNHEGKIIKVFLLEGSTIWGINGLAVDSQEDEQLLWMTTTAGHVIAAEFLNTKD